VTEETRKLLRKAERAIEAAKALLEKQSEEFAAGRAYYAMFYIASALLREKGLRFRKHAGVHSAFGEHFVKTGIFSQTFHRWLLEAYGKRIEGDYGMEAVIVETDVREMMDQAQQFLEEARRYLDPPSPQS